MKRKKVVAGILLTLIVLCITGLAFAASAPEGSTNAPKYGELAAMAFALGASMCIGTAAAGGAMGQGKAITSALEGIARNPGAAGKVMTPMIIGLAMIESLVIYALVVSLILLGKLG